MTGFKFIYHQQRCYSRKYHHEQQWTGPTVQKAQCSSTISNHFNAGVLAGREKDEKEEQKAQEAGAAAKATTAMLGRSE